MDCNGSGLGDLVWTLDGLLLGTALLRLVRSGSKLLQGWLFDTFRTHLSCRLLRN